MPAFICESEWFSSTTTSSLVTGVAAADLEEASRAVSWPDGASARCPEGALLQPVVSRPAARAAVASAVRPRCLTCSRLADDARARVCARSEACGPK